MSAARIGRPAAVRDQVLDALTDALLDGELPPGQIVSAPELAGRLGVSATPVREAMLRLVADGLVRVVPNKGFAAREPDWRDAAELVEVLRLLGPPSILAAAPQAWERLRPLASPSVASRAARLAADRAFHRALLDAAGNRQLAALATSVQLRVQAHARLQAAEPAAWQEHHALLDALIAGRAEDAAELMRRHPAAH